MTKRHLGNNTFEGTTTFAKDVTLSANLDQGLANYVNVGDLYVQDTAVLGKDPTAAMQAATKQYVDARAGNEVVVSTTDPIATYPEAELWYDSDAPLADVDPVRQWNAAWGEVYLNELAATATNLTTTPASVFQVDLTGLTAGRKLRITLSSGAGPTVSASNSEMYLAIGDTANNVWKRVRHFNPTSNTKAGPNQMLVHRANTTGTTFSFRVLAYVGSGTGLLGYSSGIEPTTIQVEDVGPVSAYVPPPNPTPAWLPFSFLNGWTSYDAARVVMYRKVGDMVQLRGLAKPGTTNTIGLLPVGYRTSYLNHAFPCGINGTGITVVEISSAGNVAISGAYGLPAYVWLDPIQFSVTP